MEQRTYSFWPLLRRVAGQFGPHRARFAIGIAFIFVGVAFEVVKPWPVAIVIDSVLEGKPLPVWLHWMPGGPPDPPAANESILVACAVSIFVIATAAGLLTLASNYLTIDVGQRMVNDLRTEIYSHLQKLSLKFHYRQQAGDLLCRVMSDTFSIQSLVMNGLLPLVSATITIGLMFWVMLGMDWLLALIALAVCPPLYVVIAKLNERIHGHAAASRDAESLLYASTERVIGAVKLVQAYGRESRNVAEFRRRSERSLATTLRLYNTQTMYGWLVDSTLALGAALIVYFGAKHVLGGRLQLANIWVFINYLHALYRPIQEMSHNLAEVSTSRAGLDRVFAVLDEQPDIQDSPHARPLPACRGEISFDHVTFAYEEGDTVIRDANLLIAPREKIALVGRTGAGKSTLASLALRFFDPQQGRVLIDGHDVRDITLASLRGHITVMLQEPILFHTSVAENIAYGRPDATPDDIRTAARRAEADEFIRNLPQGFDTVLGDDGYTLSGGQRQRLALARALLRETPVVILDEPTSALDLRTESFVWRNIEQLLAGKTAIVIAHRLSTARMADRIVVIEDGAIVEQGSHDELLARHGAYHQLWQRHSAGAELIEEEPVLAESH